MKRTLWIEAVSLLGILLAGAYFVLLLLSRFISLPIPVSSNVLGRDWAFLAIPVLGLLTGVLLQIAALRKE